MFYYVYLFSLIVLILLINNFFIKNDILINFTGENHQKFASRIKIPLTGGLYLFLGLIPFLFDNSLSLLLFLFLICTLGIFSDLKLINSASLRFLFQITLILCFTIFNEVQIIDTRIYVLDEVLKIEIINYFFVSFCVLILINGSNFIDGLNTLNIGYYLLITIVIFYLNYNDLIYLRDFELKNFIILLSIVFLFNFFNQFYLGDSGSYLLGFIFSVFLIYVYNWNSHLSPFFIILLLWYPCYETLFSIIRKYLLKKSPMSPDSNHFHQLIFFYIKKKFKLKIFTANLMTANFINLYNLVIFILCLNFISNSQIQILFILLNLIIYTVIYFKIFIIKYFKK